jgi:polyisoprenoid-binding protein YceI
MKMKKLVIISIFLFCVLFRTNSYAENAYWNLPLQINDSNTHLTFTLDTTWHTVHGLAKNVTGKIWLSDPSDFSSITGHAQLYTEDLDTNNSLRDSKMREVMGEDKHKEVSIILKKANQICNPNGLKFGESCPIELEADLTIRGTTRTITVSGNVKKTQSAYIVEAGVDLEWAKFGVEDPSIFIAKVEKIVSIQVRVVLNNH